ncbi:MAG: putative ribonucleotide transport ATP-binding protein mkl [Calditrichaeota bacterium]|nr:putative ribonucleotide transport ATP-binding protein mkl [Calditrichota bacterium]
MAGRNTVIEVRELTVSFDAHTVLRDVSFDVYEGEVLVILGESGCGKSTLMRHMIGLNRPDTGSVVYQGVDICRTDEGTLDRLRRDFGVLFQSGALFKSLTLAENVAMPAREFTELSDETIDELVQLKLEMVGLAGKGELMPSELSGGMQKRAGLARAMVLDPKVLFFDEPSAGLDPVTSAALDHLVRTLNRTLGTTMVVVTHELPSIEAIADRAIMLGRETPGILAFGTTDELKRMTEPTRVRAFFHRERIEGDVT